jgi:DNA-binding protein H-NS
MMARAATIQTGRFRIEERKVKTACIERVENYKSFFRLKKTIGITAEMMSRTMTIG